MFREVTRKKQALSPEECRELLINEKRGVLSVVDADGYPYAMPINHYYDPESGNLYFHTGIGGHRSEALAQCDKVSFCVTDSGFRREGEWALNIKSVIVFGRMRPLEDHERAIAFSRALSYKFTDDTAYIEREIERSGARVQCWELTPEHITGKLVNES